MPTTFDYRVRDKTGALVTGKLVGDNEALVMTKLREMGLTPIRVKKASTGLKMEIHLRPGRVKLIHEVKLPRPRDVIRIRETDAYAREFSTLWHVLGEEFAKATEIG